MPTAKEFVDALSELILDKRRPNVRQSACIEHTLDPALMIVAGPGSGKTTVLVLRALKHVIVDNVLPEEVVITTFTKKAATEIRSRLIDWGIPLIGHFLKRAKSEKDTALEKHLSVCDVNAFVTGTLDSLCEKWVGRMRQQGEIPPVMVESFAARQIYSRQVFGKIYRNDANKAVLDPFLAQYTWEGNPPNSLGEAVDIAKIIIDRIVQDRVDVDVFAKKKGQHHRARQLIAQSFVDLHNFMRLRGQYDFALLEAEFLRKLHDQSLLMKILLPRVLLIDEYQDTNPLQEAIYFKLAEVSNAVLTIVGDDDQALYRFRGATVELFRDFSSRYIYELKRQAPRIEFLVDNYRSTEAVVEFCNLFINNDPRFKGARVDPPKPEIAASGKNKSKRIPVLGMFRSTPDVLAKDLASFIYEIFKGKGIVIPQSEELLKKDDQAGDVADGVLLAHSVAEFGKPFGSRPATSKFPWLLRQALADEDIPVFNPRGRALKDIPQVRQLLGLACLCLDSDQTLLAELSIYGNAKREMVAWRLEAQAFINTNPVPNKPRELQEFVEAWQQQEPQARGMRDWPREWPFLDLLYKLVTWFADFQNLPEYQVYLEAITRSVTQATAFSPYQGRLMRDEPHKRLSRLSALRDILAPVAEDVVEVDEDLLTHLPRNHLNVMTIHQAKGLEFPLVIVDVGAHFGGDYPKARFRRFPESPSNVTRLEDDLAPFSEVGKLRLRRTAIDRTFEDLIRLYYVAYSRPQTVLLLIGHTKLLQYATTVKNVATFWQQDGSWPWRKKTPFIGKKPPASVSNMGIVEI